ncbi:MAG: hypothetical protein Q7T41_02780 [Candidatus Saccharibacteria bacterium]|nr:hypothetical protein [Candidatus Saccharibacteria bacterium]
MSTGGDPDIHLQNGGEFPLNLSEIDPRLAMTGRSVEDLSNPEFRLIVLWTTIGQYRASAQLEKEENNDSLVLNDVRYYQLLSTWTAESRRVNPLVRNEPTPPEIDDLIKSNQFVKAYNEIVELRDFMPELIHPDKRFDLLYTLLERASKLPSGDTLAMIINQDILNETVPGGISFCDDTERLRRYLKLSDINPTYIGIIDNFFGALVSNDETIKSNYFDHNSIDLRAFCELLVKRQCRELALFVTSRGYVDLDNQAILIPLLNEPA